METLVVGAGSMGRWFGEALRTDGPASVSVSFLDLDDDRAREAAAAVDGEVAPSDATTSFDLVCIAVPIPAATEAIAAHAGRAERAVVDLTGAMADPVGAMREHAPDLERASLHPLFAPGNEPGNVPVVVDAGGPVVDEVLATLETRGNDVFETTVTRHDEAMETVQARTHAAVLAFGLSAAPVSERFQTPISAALSELVEQVTGGDSRVYADIQAAFDGADDVAEAARRVADADRETFEQVYEDARIEADGKTEDSE